MEENKEITKQITVRNKGQLETILVKSDSSLDRRITFNSIPDDYGLYSFPHGQFYNDNSQVRDYWQRSYPALNHQLIDIVWTCVHKRAEVFSSAYPIVKKRKNQREADEILDLEDAAVRLFDYPQGMDCNTTYTDIMYKHLMHRDTFGNTYILILRDNDKHPVTHLGVPVELHVLDIYDNDQMKPRYDNNRKLTHWEYRPDARLSEFIRYEEHDILHIKLPTLNNPFYGSGIIQSLKLPLSIKNYILSTQLDLFKNGAAKKMFYKAESGSNPEQVKAWKEKEDKKQSGTKDKTKSTVIPPGLDLIAGNFSPDESQMVEVLKFNMIQIIGAFGTPPSLVSWVEDVNKANAINALIDFAKITIKPLLHQYDDIMTRFVQRNFDRKLEVIHELGLLAPIEAETKKPKDKENVN